MAMEDNNRGMLLFGIGCAAGIAGTLLLTSRSGRETVAYLRSKAEEGTQTVKDSVDSLSHVVERGKKAVRYQAENVAAAVEAGKQAFKVAQETTP